MQKLIIFTDLDGTLLDHDSYSYASSQEALEKIKETDTPLIFLTSKTQDEVIRLQSELEINDPFAVENGEGIYIPEAYFPFPLEEALHTYQVRKENNFFIIEFGMRFEESKKILAEVSQEAGVGIILQSSMTPEEFAQSTGLSVSDAKRSLARQYIEGFSITGSPEEKAEKMQRMREGLQKKGYDLTSGGRFGWIEGKGSKRKAVEILRRLYELQYTDVVTVGIGDGPNDLEFIEQCNHGYLVANPKKVIEVDSDKVEKVDEPGPKGWNKVVLSLLK